MKSITHYMSEALKLAKEAYDLDEVPVGAVVVRNEEVIASAHNKVKNHHNPIGHAEILALSAAGSRLGTSHLDDCDLFVTLEPCPMCASAISLARIRNLYFGAYDIKSGGIAGASEIFKLNSCHHKPSWYGGIMEEQSAELLQSFFQKLRT